MSMPHEHLIKPEDQSLTRRELLRSGAALGAALLCGEITELSVQTADSPAATDPFAEQSVQLEKYLPRSHFIRQGPSDRRNVAITIDDFYGVSSISYLDKVLVMGREQKVHFSFFPIGQAQLENFNARPGVTRDAWRRALSEGHTIGNHTYDHQLLGTMPTRRIKQELRGQSSAMNRVLGLTHRELLMRPPGGSGGFKSPGLHNQFVHTLDAVKELGYYMTMWTVDSNAPDGQIVTPDEDARFLNKIFHDPVEHVRNGSIILVHPTTLSVAGIGKLISGLKERRFNVLSVPELFKPPAHQG